MHGAQQFGPSGERRLRRLAKIAAWSLGGGMIGAVAGSFIGLNIGAGYGGNFATDFRFGDLVGYEATGVLGAIIGAAVGFVGAATVSGILAVRSHRLSAGSSHTS